MVNALAWAVERPAIVLGKPNTLGLKMILSSAQAKLDECIMIGDRLDTDVKVANNFSKLFLFENNNFNK